ncbi:MAG: hypothetical protein ACD_58C00296G0002 [uncultured bacterium]|nr:MAG: hypothetical protein ACD_58C00296G0002 [uncultured bacterium]
MSVTAKTKPLMNIVYIRVGQCFLHKGEVYIKTEPFGLVASMFQYVNLMTKKPVETLRADCSLQELYVEIISMRKAIQLLTQAITGKI